MTWKIEPKNLKLSNSLKLLWVKIWIIIQRDNFDKLSRDSRLSVSDKSKYKRQIDTRDRVGIYVVLDTQSNVSGDLNITCFCYQKLYTRNPCFSVADTLVWHWHSSECLWRLEYYMFLLSKIIYEEPLFLVSLGRWHSSECLWRLAYYVFVIKNYIQETPVSRIYEKPPVVKLVFVLVPFLHKFCSYNYHTNLRCFLSS